jgi:1-deoxy-D-xylulose-5-phosphate synthase
VFGETLCRLARTDPRIVAITAAMQQGTGLDGFAAQFPGRFYDVGIAEQHAVTFAAGLACEGFRPVCAIYSTFLQRAFDQLVHDVCLQELPVILAMDRAGVVGSDGPTHHGAFDIAYLRLIPNLALLAPANEDELAQMLALAIDCNRPVALRYPRGQGLGVPLQAFGALRWGKAHVVANDGDDLLLLALGSMVGLATETAAALRREGVGCTVVNARFAKPLDSDTIVPLLMRARAVITLEEGCVAGGFGSSILELAQENGISVPIRLAGLPDHFLPHGKASKLLLACGLSVDRLVMTYRQLRSTRKVISLI